MKKKILICLILIALLAFATPVALAWYESGSPYYHYVDAVYLGYHNTGTLSIELNGNSSSGQVFLVGETVTITGDIHSYAGICAYYNEAYTEWELSVSGPSGPDSDGDYDYDYSGVSCAEVESIETPTITYNLTTTGTHTVYLYSDAQVAYDGIDLYDDFAETLLTFDVVQVNIDIKPGSCPNSINLGTKGVVPVAILTADGFDAGTVDPATVEFAGAAPLRWALEDVDYDGDLDMIFLFKTQELGLDGSSTEATLTGETVGGVSFDATDSVNIVPVD